jgi:hypothetical protein
VKYGQPAVAIAAGGQMTVRPTRFIVANLIADVV